MFDRDWKESREKNILAPTEYSWEAFKAAITLLYGVEAEVDESSVLDVYKVAHCYDLGNVKGVLAQAISQWGADMMGTVVELCALAGDLETEEDQREHEVIQAGSSYIVKHLALIKAESSDLNGLPYEAMLKVVQSEDITAPELNIFLLLNQWMKGHLDITLRQAQQLYSHIRFGIIPYEFLYFGITWENLSLTLKNHQKLSVDKVKNNLKLITPRLFQSEVLQVYPLVEGLLVSRTIDRWDFVDVRHPANYTVGVIFSGRQDLTFKLSLNVEAYQASKLFVELSDVCGMHATKPEAQIHLLQDFQGAVGLLSFMEYDVKLKSTGAFLVQMCSQDQHGNDYPDDDYVCKSVDLPFQGPFPWILKIGVPGNRSVSMSLYYEFRL